MKSCFEGSSKCSRKLPNHDSLELYRIIKKIVDFPWFVRACLQYVIDVVEYVNAICSESLEVVAEA